MKSLSNATVENATPNSSTVSVAQPNTLLETLSSSFCLSAMVKIRNKMLGINLATTIDRLMVGKRRMKN